MSLTQPPPEQEPQRSSLLRAMLPYTTTLLVIALLYVAWTFYSRHDDEVQRTKTLDTQKQDQEKRVAQQIYGSGDVKIVKFSADKGFLAPGEKTELCYGVLNAKTVKLDPPVEPLKPTYTHCMDIAPKKTTTYTLTASGDNGSSQNRSLTVRVK